MRNRNSEIALCKIGFRCYIFTYSRASPLASAHAALTIDGSMGGHQASDGRNLRW